MEKDTLIDEKIKSNKEGTNNDIQAKESSKSDKLRLNQVSKNQLIVNSIKEENHGRDKSKIINEEKMRDIDAKVNMENNIIAKNVQISKKLPETGNSNYSILGALLSILGFKLNRRKKER